MDQFSVHQHCFYAPAYSLCQAVDEWIAKESNQRVAKEQIFNFELFFSLLLIPEASLTHAR